MYGLGICSLCRRVRIIDKSLKSSSCPYCDYKEEHKRIIIVFECADQETARKALAESYDVEIPDPEVKKKSIEKKDPYSTMVYKFEHASDLDEKMIILAEGLTECKGEFTIEDVADVVGEKNAEKYISAMLDRCYIAEVKIGRYKG